MSTAGVVIYQIRHDGSLEGRWTHPDLRGMVATERAWGGPSGKLPGAYRVQINTPDDHIIFEGSLTIDEIGAAYALTWSGSQLLPQPRAARYSGIGVVEHGDTLVATFQEDEAARGLATLREVWGKIPGPKGERFAEAFAHGTLRVLLYAPRQTDPQTPHEQDEVYVVMRGSGFFTLAGAKRPFAEGDVLFTPARTPHRFEQFSDDLVVWVVFYGPTGGETAGDVRKEIEQVNGGFAAAYAKGDAAAVAALYTAGAKLFPPGGPIVDGRAGIEQFWQSVMGSGIKNIELRTAEIEVFGDTVVENGSATLCSNGGVANRGKYLVVWKRVEGKWLLHRDCWNSNGPATKD